MNRTSNYSRLLAGRDNSGRPIWDRILWETEDFICVPTQGSIVAGWVLVIPKSDTLSFGHLSIERRLSGERFARMVSEKIESKFGPVAWFEHGPMRAGSPVGCSVDHAHLHIVPISADLLSKARELTGPKVIWTKVKGLGSTADACALQRDYLYLRQNGSEWLATGATLGSQVFRRVIAEACGCADKYDWRKYPFEDEVRVTLQACESSAEFAAA